MPKCFSAWNAVLNKSVPMHFRHLKNMKHNGPRLVKIWQSLYYKACTNYFPVLLCATSWQDNLLGETFERRVFAASPIDTATPQENQRLETRHVGAAKRAFRARLPPILTLSTRYQTGWNVTKCHACHAKRHDNLLGNLRKGEVLQLPP